MDDQRNLVQALQIAQRTDVGFWKRAVNVFFNFKLNQISSGRKAFLKMKGCLVPAVSLAPPLRQLYMAFPDWFERYMKGKFAHLPK